MRMQLLRSNTPPRRWYLRSTSRQNSVSTVDRTNWSIGSFRNHVAAERPRPLLCRELYKAALALKNWFAIRDAADKSKGYALNVDYLRQFEGATIPVELTQGDQFSRVEVPLGVFLDMQENKPANASVYLAQCPIADLPQQLQADVPTPTEVLSTGKGDIYGSSIWIGPAPTYTPLHRDPNPNLFVHLAGRKIVRLMTPEMGNMVFRNVQKELGINRDPRIRGEDMMAGQQRILMDRQVWGKDWTEGISLSEQDNQVSQRSVEAVLEPGDALFIPTGWWHSVRGVGRGISGSANWWWR